jgi:hypothetical protein
MNLKMRHPLGLIGIVWPVEIAGRVRAESSTLPRLLLVDQSQTHLPNS